MKKFTFSTLSHSTVGINRHSWNVLPIAIAMLFALAPFSGIHAQGKGKAPTGKGPLVMPNVNDSKEKKKEVQDRLGLIFAHCTQETFPSLAAVDSTDVLDDDEKLLCKERLKLLNPIPDEDFPIVEDPQSQPVNEEAAP